MMDEILDEIAQSRRLRILRNRLMIFGSPIFYTNWREYTFLTALGYRKAITTKYNKVLGDRTYVVYEFIYEDAVTGEVIFKLLWTQNECVVEKSTIPDDAIWLAIYELEQMSAEICRERIDEVI